jgi:hypothetical protein
MDGRPPLAYIFWNSGESFFFSYISPEQLVRKDHPLRPIRAMEFCDYREDRLGLLPQNTLHRVESVAKRILVLQDASITFLDFNRRLVFRSAVLSFFLLAV